jgi:DNA-binding beta-propeller fold protein YncE
MGVELGQGGLVHVCDSVNHRVESFRQDGAHVRSVGGEGSEHEVDCPYDIAIAPSGEIVLAEYGGHCVSRFTASGAFVAAYGSPGRRNRQFNGPRGVAVDAQGRVYAADTDNHRIQRFTPGGLA